MDAIVAEYVSNYELRIADRVLGLTQLTTPGGTRINKTGIAPAVSVPRVGLRAPAMRSTT